MLLTQETVKDVKRALNRMKCRFLRHWGHRDYKRFIVLSRSRTGSNLLISLFNSHPNICARSEIFQKLDGKNYKDILEETFSKQPFYVRAVGFKIFYYHPLDDNSCGIWNELISMQGLYVIHLKRRNVLRTLLSRKIAENEGVWKKTCDAPLNGTHQKTVEFTVEELKNGFEKTRSRETTGDKMFCQHQILNIYYEDLARDPESEFRKVMNFLGLRYIKPRTNLQRQNPEKISELITNYAELKTAFSGSQWERYFED